MTMVIQIRGIVKNTIDGLEEKMYNPRDFSLYNLKAQFLCYLSYI